MAGVNVAKAQMASLRGSVMGANAAMSGSAAALATGLASAAAAPLAVGAGLLSLIKTSEMFDRQMLRSMSIMGTLSDTMKSALREEAIEVARVTRFSAAELGRAYFFMASAGMTAAQSVRSLGLVAKFAQAGQFDLALATDLLTDAQTALRMTSSDAAKSMQNLARIGDVLVKANTLANATVQQFSEALTNKAGAAMVTFGQDLETTVAVLAAFASAGKKGAEAGTALSIVLKDLTTKGIQNKAAWHELGLSVFDADGNLRNMADIIGELTTVLDGMSDEVKKATLLELGFSDKSMQHTLVLLGQADAMREYEAELRNANGTMDAVSQNMTDMEKAWNRIGASWTAISQQAKTGFIPALLEVVAAILEFIEKTQIVNIIGTAFMNTVDMLKTGIFGLAAGALNAAASFARLGEWLGIVSEGSADFLESMADDLEDQALDAFDRTIERMDDLYNAWSNDIPDAADDAADAAKALAEQVEKLTPEQLEAERAAKALAEQVERFADRVKADLMTPLERYEEQVRRLEEALDAGHLTQDQFTEAVRRAKEELDETSDAMRELEREAERVFEQTRTPLEKFEAEIQRLQKLLDEGLIDKDTFERAVKQAEDRLQRARDALKQDEPVAEEAKSGTFQQIALRRTALDFQGSRKSHERKVEDHLKRAVELLKDLREHQGDPVEFEFG